MILLFDVGNTSIYVGMVINDEIVNTFRINTDSTKTPDEYSLIINDIIKDNRVSGVAIASVVPNITIILKKLSIKYFNINPFIVSVGVKTGIKVLADNPKEVGADLICDAAGIKSELPTLIVDLGTANKMIYVKNKTIIGVIISPGIQLSMSALAGGTALLHEIELIPPAKVLGTNTINCLQSGLIYGTAAFIEGMVQRIKEEVNEDFSIVITGGLSKLLLPHIKLDVLRDSRLVLKGLLTIYNKNHGKK